MQIIGNYKTIDNEAPGLQMILSMAEHDISILTGLIESVLTHSPALMQGVEDGVKNNDAPQLKITAHSLKSSCAMVGAMTVADMCQELENIGHHAQLEKASELLYKLKPEFTDMIRDLTDWKNLLDSN